VHYTNTVEERHYLASAIRLLGWFGHLFVGEYLLNLRNAAVTHYAAPDSFSALDIPAAIEKMNVSSSRGDELKGVMELQRQFNRDDEEEAKKNAPKAEVFQVMRSSHEAFRAMMLGMDAALERDGDLDAFKTGWDEFQRAMVTHAYMEDSGLFPFLNVLSGGAIGQAGLDSEHDVDRANVKAVVAALKSRDLASIRAAFVPWKEFMDFHLRHEELLMLPFTKRAGKCFGFVFEGGGGSLFLDRKRFARASAARSSLRDCASGEKRRLGMVCGLHCKVAGYSRQPHASARVGGSHFLLGTPGWCFWIFLASTKLHTGNNDSGNLEPVRFGNSSSTSREDC
jgi:hypothetical protein